MTRGPVSGQAADLTTYFCDHAWLGGDATAKAVLVSVHDGRITAVEAGAREPREAVHLAGVTLPGFANVHSHAFHRALRGRTQRGGGTFWSWREQMYRVAAALSPESYYALARATYAEMTLAGFTSVGEFHYLHHQPGGAPYADANEMGAALVAAACEAGIRITLLDTCYLESAPGRPAEGPQLRFADAGAEAWAERVAGLHLGAGARLGAAIHSVRAVPPAAARLVAHAAASNDLPLHFHLSEQVSENETAIAAYGATPAAVLGGSGALGPTAVAVHGTHLSGKDVELLASSGTGVCMCPTTERDLADGVGPARLLAEAGAPISLGSDSHAVIDAFEEMRGLELDERLVSGRRGHWSAPELLVAATSAGHEAIGWPDCGRIAPGSVADLVTVTLDSPRLAGATPRSFVEHVVFAGSAPDVTDVVVAGRVVVSQGRHRLVGDVSAALGAAISSVVER
ncbi:MAG: Formiminoglutamate deiminase [Acidimicrobiaceae bacterium]|nr:Formiminoglutamate deiminase [Acidimicrobiaceae bacterium]